MTEPIVCHKGKCEKKHKTYLDECLDCNIVEQLEHDLLKKEIGGA